MNKKLVIWGASGHAAMVADIIRLRGEYEIVGFLDDINSKRHGMEFCGSTILGGKEQLDFLAKQNVQNLIVGFGNCNVRVKLAELIKSKGFNLITAIHPQAIIAANVSIGAGSVIMPGAVINTLSVIGENVIINTCASVDHECMIGKGAHICPGTHLAGQVTIGQTTWVGIGSTIIDKVKIGHRTFIGAGAVVVNNIPDDVVAYGVPAKVIRKVAISD